MIKKLIVKLLNMFRKDRLLVLTATPIEKERWPFRKGDVGVTEMTICTFYFTARTNHQEFGLGLYGNSCSLGSDPFVGIEEQAYQEAGRRAKIYENTKGEEILEVKYNDFAFLEED